MLSSKSNKIDGDTFRATVVVSGEHIRASAEMGTRPKGICDGGAKTPGVQFSTAKQTSRWMKAGEFSGQRTGSRSLSFCIYVPVYSILAAERS